jgi:hypothetical protein
MPDTTTVGKWIVLIGLGLAAIGVLVWLLGRAGLPLGRLPGDINFQSGNFSFYFPCASSILISVALTLVLNLVIRLLRR